MRFEYLKFFLKCLLTLNGLFILNFYSLHRSILVLHATAVERYSDEKPTKNYKRKSFKVWKLNDAGGYAIVEMTMY